MMASATSVAARLIAGSGVKVGGLGVRVGVSVGGGKGVSVGGNVGLLRTVGVDEGVGVNVGTLFKVAVGTCGDVSSVTTGVPMAIQTTWAT